MNLALHRPLHAGFAEKGKVGIPFYGSYDEVVAEFGAGTFDVFSTFYKHPNFFLEKGLTKNKCFFVRLADNTADAAALVLECSVYEVETVQYQKDPQGFRLTDINGDWIPKNVRGNRFTDEMTSIIRGGKRKQKFFFENIQAKGPDGTTRSLNPINLELK